MPQTSAPRPPVAPARPVAFEAHGESWTDEYHWLRAENWQEVLRDPDVTPREIARLLKAENRHCKALMADTAELQKTLVREMRGRMKEDDAAPPRRDGPFAYYSRYLKRAEHPLICRKPRDGGKEQRLLDANALARGKEFFELGETAHSPDHKLLAWSCDEAGSELHTIRVRDLATGADLPDEIAETTGDMEWAADSRSFFYIRVDANHRPSRVFRHVLGTDPAADELIHWEHDAGMFVSIGQTQSGRYLLVDISDHETSEVRMLDLEAPGATLSAVSPRRPGLRYDVDHHGDTLYIATNRDGCDDMKIMTAPVAAPGPENWRELISCRPGVMILSHVCLRGRLIRMERENALPRIVIRDLASGAESAIAFDEEAYSLGLDPGLEFDTDMIRYTYSSMARPSEVWDYDMASGARTLVKRQEVPSGHDPSAYVVRRILARAHDGQEIPVSILHRAGLRLDGSAPCLLYAYGSYGSSMSASFRTRQLSLVDRGFVYAIAHVRGGTEKGWAWYLAGKKFNKTNTFRDFISAAETLCELGYAGPGRIVAQGGSAGGMLMGAIANMAPSLWAGVIADVPFVDVLNTIMDGTLPLTPPEWPEWGDPVRDPEAFRYIRAYSPTSR